jgi:hypothetical protein
MSTFLSLTQSWAVRGFAGALLPLAANVPGAGELGRRIREVARDAHRLALLLLRCAAAAMLHAGSRNFARQDFQKTRAPLFDVNTA